jgi:hypothetical protein
MDLTDQQWTIIVRRARGLASPHEVRLVDATLEDRFIMPYPPRLIGDRVYDSDRLDAALWTNFGIELIAPASGRPRAPDAGRPGAPTLPAVLGRRTVLCLAAQLAAAHHEMWSCNWERSSSTGNGGLG